MRDAVRAARLSRANSRLNGNYTGILSRLEEWDPRKARKSANAREYSRRKSAGKFEAPSGADSCAHGRVKD